MVDIQPILAQTATTPAAATPLTALQVAIADITQALATLTRSIQVNATVAAAPAVTPQGSELTLITSLGTLTVTLPALSAAEQQALTQVLLNLVQTQKPVTLTVLPGSPPTQAVLLVPATTTAPQQQQGLPQTGLPPQPVVVGNNLPAVVLPSSTSPALPSSQPPATVTIILQNQPVPPQDGQVTTAPLPAPGPVAVTPPANAPGIGAALPPPTPLNTTLPLPQGQARAPVSAPQIVVVQSVADLPSTPVVTALSTPPQVVSMPQVVAVSPPAAPLPLAALLQTGNDVTLHVDAVLKAGQPLPILEPNQIVATVVGTATGGQIILKAGDANLFVKANVTAAPGTQILVTVTADRSSPLVTFPPIDPLTFTALPQAMATLAQVDPQALAQMMAGRVPQPTEALPGALLFFMSAFKQGNVRGWLGDDATEALMQAGRGDLVTNLSHDLAGSGQTAQDTVVGQWRTYPIPLYSQQNFQALTLYVHDGRKDREGERGAVGGAAKIRFLIDMRLSKLGEMQLDGFVQPKKLDMVLRSAARLPEGLHHHLRGAYIRALGAVGYVGSINFQVGRAQWMTMSRSGTQTVA